MHAAACAFLSITILLSGCLGDVQDPVATPSLVGPPDHRIDLAHAPNGTLAWEATCAPVCPSFSFSLLEVLDARLEVSVTWDHREPTFIERAYTSTLHHDGTAWEPVDMRFASMHLLDEPSVGDYRLEVQAAEGAKTIPFQVIVQWEPRPVPDANGDFLPDLGALVPVHLAIHDGGRGESFPFTGCHLPETVEQEATRCLRFSSGFSNHGAGDLFAYLDDKSPRGGEWVQVIETVDGTREAPGGRSSFHLAHRHYHYEGALEATVYEFDLESVQRGSAVTEGRKTGFCFEDWGLSEPGRLGTAQASYACLEGEQPEAVEIARATLDPVMGVSAGWFDLYLWGLPDQYVDMADVPNGVYELANLANPDGTLTEISRDDNESSMVFRLVGNTVEMLGTPEELGA